MRALITGINGYISQFLLKNKPVNVSIIGTYHKRALKSKQTDLVQILLDLKKDVHSQLKDIHPDVVIHTAAVSNLGLCEKMPDLAFRVNSYAAEELATWCNEKNIRFVYLSTDIVFDGQNAPYNENDTPQPINIYGKSKFKGELAARKSRNYVIARLALVLGQGLGENKNFVDWIVDRVNKDQPVPLFYDEIRTPIKAIDAAFILWEIALSKEQGIFHLCSDESMDRFSLGKKICKHYKNSFKLIDSVSIKKLEIKRPIDASMINRRLDEKFNIKIPSVLKSIERLFLNYE